MQVVKKISRCREIEKMLRCHRKTLLAVPVRTVVVGFFSSPCLFPIWRQLKKAILRQKQIILFCCFIVPMQLFAGPRIDMVVGEERHLEFPPLARINLSRKGILHLAQKDESHWVVTALKKGIVALDRYPESGGAKESTVIRVRSPDDEKDPRTLVGEAKSIAEFQKLKEDCDADALCIFRMTLNAEHVQNLRRIIAGKVGPATEVDIAQDGGFSVLKTCGKPEERKSLEVELKKISELHLAKSPLHLLCREDFSAQRFRVSFRISTSTISEEKLRTSTAPTSVQVDISAPTARLSPEFEVGGVAVDRNTALTGDPMIDVDSDQEGILKSGGEILVRSDGDDNGRKKQFWKEYGIAAMVKAVPSFGPFVKLAVDFQLRTLTSSEEGTLTLSQIKTTRHLKLGEQTMIGNAIINSQSDDEGRSLLLGKFPLIGPLFSNEFKSRQKTLLSLHVKVDEISSMN